MGRFFYKHGNIILSIVGAIAALGVVFLIGNNVLENRANQKYEQENEMVYTTTTTTTAAQPEETIDKVALPDVIYVSAGEPIVIRFLNITGYNALEDMAVKVETGGKGKVYTDRWEYTPEKAETFFLSFTVNDKEGNLINESTHTIEVKEPSDRDEMTVLVIGDSTVQAGRETEKMLALAKEDNFNLKLLGTLSQEWLKDQNNRHEGRGGWKAVTYVEKSGTENTGAINPFYNPETETFDFAYYMQNQGYTSVDCVFLQLGINDVFGAATDKALNSSTFAKKYFENMDIIIENIHSYDPDIQIVWNLILPGSVEQEKFEAAYDEQTADRYKRNTYLTNLEIVKHVAGMSNVFIAPTNAVLNTVENMAAAGSGAVHPGEKGYAEIGQLMYSFLRAINE